MESFFPPIEALFDERAKHPVLLVDAVEESANVTLSAEIASGEMYGMTLVCHISPHVYRRDTTESTIADADAIAIDKSAGAYHRPTGREDYNRGVVVRHGSPRLDGVRGWVRSRLSERKTSYYRKF